MVARADGVVSDGLQQPEVLEDHCALRIERESGRDVEVVTGEDDEIEVRGDVHHPVELRQVVVAIGDEKDAHEVRRVRRTPASIGQVRGT